VEGKVLVISKEQVENLINKLNDPAKLDESRDEVKKMIEIKSALLWRAEPETCCGSLCQIRTCLTSEVQILEGVLNALDEGNISQASSLLREYMYYLEQLRQ
jgi:ArsR family metal-binding transcriptional regulator